MVQDLEEVFQLHVSQFLTMDRQPLPGASPFTAEPVYLLPAELQQQTADLPRSGARCGVSARGCVTWQSDISYKPQTYWKLPKQVIVQAYLSICQGVHCYCPTVQLFHRGHVKYSISL